METYYKHKEKKSSWAFFSVKVISMSAAVVSTAVILRLSLPSIMLFVSSDLPKIYSGVISWLTPPYLYFVINFIIISIAASSRFHKSATDHEVDVVGSGSVAAVPAPLVAKQEFVVAPPLVVQQPEFVVAPVEVLKEEVVDKEESEEFVISRSSWTPKSKEVTEYSFLTEKEEQAESATEIPTEYSFLNEKMEKPLVSARLGRRKSLKSSPEAGKALRVTRPKRNETLENTWKTITGGHNVPLTRHLKKSDTWETNHSRPTARDEPAEPLMRKSETFNDRGARRPPPSASPNGPSPAARLRKEPSIGQDDLNRRVEAFINKFNHEMRLQRQESFAHYRDMINRGSH